MLSFFKPKSKKLIDQQKKKGFLLSEKALSLRHFMANPDYMKINPAPLFIPPACMKTHSIIFGGTRTGKTRIGMGLADWAIKSGYDLVVIDPKMEQTDSSLFNQLVQSALEAKRLEDMVYCDVMDPERSAKFNPYSDYAHVHEIVEHLMAAIGPIDKKFFKDQAKRLAVFAVETYEYFARKDGIQPVFTVSKLMQICSYQWVSEMVELLEAETAVNPAVKELYLRGKMLADLGQQQFEHFHSTLYNVFTNLGTGVVGEIIDTEKGADIFQRLWDGKGVIMYFYTGSLLVREAAGMVSRVFLSAITSLVGKVLRFKMNGGKLPRPLLIIVDECQMAVYPGIEDLLDKAGGAGVWLSFLTQTKANLKNVLGPDLTSVFLDNIGTQIFLRCGDAQETGRYVSAKAGEIPKMEVWKRTSDLGDGSTVRETPRRVLDDAAVTRLPDREFIGFVQQPSMPTQVYLGFVRNIPTPRVRVTGLKTLDELQKKHELTTPPQDYYGAVPTVPVGDIDITPMPEPSEVVYH